MTEGVLQSSTRHNTLRSTAWARPIRATWLTLRGYLAVAVTLMVVKVVQLALGHWCAERRHS
jgi:hypothetical protein